MKYLTNDEIKRLFVPLVDLRDKLLIQLGLVLGCRVSEICNISLSDLKSDRIVLHDQKKNVLRDVIIDNSTKSLIEAYLHDQRQPTEYGRHKLFDFSTKTANRIIKHYFSLADIPADKAHWHTLRHTYIVHSLERGVPLNHIVEQTGDSIGTIISVYGRPSIDDRKAMIEDKGRYWE